MEGLLRHAKVRFHPESSKNLPLKDVKKDRVQCSPGGIRTPSIFTERKGKRCLCGDNLSTIGQVVVTE